MAQPNQTNQKKQVGLVGLQKKAGAKEVVLTNLNDLEIEEMVQNPNYRSSESELAADAELAQSAGQVKIHRGPGKEEAPVWTDAAVRDLQTTVVTSQTILGKKRKQMLAIETADAKQQILDLFN